MVDIYEILSRIGAILHVIIYLLTSMLFSGATWNDLSLEKMRRSGYSLSNSDHGCFVLNKIGARPIEFYSIKNHKDGSCLKPEIFPDFIVNTLMFDGNPLQSWNSVVDDKSISVAINHIRDKKAGILDADHLRKKKILSKGYTLN